jgi:hypothetical protein
MSDYNEIRALKASLRGVLDTTESLAAVRERVEALDDHSAIETELLEDLARLTSAHAVASAALRGLVNAMQSRRAADAAT